MTKLSRILDDEPSIQAIVHLRKEMLWVWFATLLDPLSRGARTAHILQEAMLIDDAGRPFSPAQVDALTVELDGLGLLSPQAQRQKPLTHYPVKALLAAWRREPERMKRLAAILYRRGAFAEKALANNNSSSWNQRSYLQFDYTDLPLRATLLALANQGPELNDLLREYEQLADWRNPERKAEALASAYSILLYLDADLLTHFDPTIQLEAVSLRMGLNAEDWNADTVQTALSFFADPYLAALNTDQAMRQRIELAAIYAWQQMPDGDQLIEAYKEFGLLDKLLRKSAGREDLSTLEMPSTQAKAYSPWGMLQWFCFGESRHLPLLKSIVAQPIATGQAGAKLCLEALVWYLSDSYAQLEQHLNAQLDKCEDLLPHQIVSLLWLYLWTGLKPDAESWYSLNQWASAKNLLAQQHYLRGELLYTLSKLAPGDPQSKRWANESEEIAQSFGLSYLVDQRHQPASWTHSIRVLEQLLNRPVAEPEDEEVSDKTRLLWVIEPDQQEVFVRLQSLGKRGWSKGRRMDLSQLMADGAELLEMDEDQMVVDRLMRVNGNTMGGLDTMLRLPYGAVLYALAGHPQVVLGDTMRIPLEITRGNAELIVDRSDDGLRFSFHPAGANSGYHIERETPTRLRVFKLDEDQALLSRSLGNQVVVPEEEANGLLDKLSRLRRYVKVQNLLEEDNDLPQVAADARPCVHVLAFGEAFKIEMLARPLPGQDFYLGLGTGAARSIVRRNLEPTEGALDSASAKTERVLLIRDLRAEEEAATHVLEACPTLAGVPHLELEWTIEDPTQMLEVLFELRELQALGEISIEHPKGERLRLAGQAGSAQLSIRIDKQRDWFEVDASLKTDEGLVISMSRLLEQTRKSRGRFIELEDGAFLAITEELQSRLLAMDALLTEQGGQLQLSDLAAGAFAELLNGLEDVSLDAAWRQTIYRIAESESFEAKLPEGLEVELRPYQVEGYEWLSRLANWGVGACLADDMGLGKTIQALTLMLSRADLGPSLVIAPASVTRNWVNEARRFVPALSMKHVASSADLRMLRKLKAADVVVISYGLLSFVEEELSDTEFATIVIDEAQAIKNPGTKRAKLIFQLRGQMKIATTGTPIENHLGELWSLFRFINPGLLGSLAQFNEKFAGPIRRDGDQARAQHLTRLVQPFILRRRKASVLKELPPKTEINLMVELSEQEMAMYEALRREAVEQITKASSQAQRMIVLKQLTLLRQAACHPRLIHPQSTLSSSKLELVGETILELLDNGHKALVFSQFVRHLSLVEDWVRAQGIRYCYLDGSTPGGKRQQQVDAFQNGEADLFLISLKAGGTGLNLTAADFVLHLDPWWNPAVEDQASDRAHRIGQTRPVTVYRFVSENTIEERILALHEDKRDLADRILAGTDSSGQLSVAEVVDLLKAGI